MYVRDDLTLERDDQVLLHELVHHFQWMSDRQYDCPGAREAEAYEVQKSYAEAVGQKPCGPGVGATPDPPGPRTTPAGGLCNSKETPPRGLEAPARSHQRRAAGTSRIYTRWQDTT
jgi:hypothetical protein